MTVANVNVTKVLFKRGNTVQNNAYTGVSGEITIDTQAKTLRIHDGSTVGGNIITATLTGNAGSQQQSIDSLNANVGAYQIYANSNAASQTTEINSLRSNITAANSAITSLTSNAAIQAALLDTLTGNAATQSTVLDTLTSNAASQATTLATLLSNAVAQQTSLIDLVSNAATQQNSIATLLANAVTQAQQIANVTGTYSNTNVAAYLSAFDGNILPSANVTYSLGDSTHQWKDLWVSNNTIYIGGTPVRVDGGTLLVNNAPVSGAYGNTQVADYLLGDISTGNITATANVMVIGTGDAKLTLDSFNQAALLQAKKTFNRSFGAGEGASFVYSNVAGTGSITATITNDLYLKTLLERLSTQFSTPTPEFTYSYSNVRVQVYDVTNANVIANVTGVDNYGNPDEYTLLIDQPPTPDPFSVVALDISYDYLNTVGVDVDKDLFGITTDNDDIDIKSGRDIDLQARDDFFVTAGSQFTMTLNANDGQSSTDGIILQTQANGTTRSWKYRFDGATEFASGLTAEPLSNYVPVSGTKIIQSANEILELVSTGDSGQTTVGWTEVPNGTANIAAIGFNALVAGGVNITAGNLNFATASTWQFDKTGNLTLPNGTLIRDTGSVGISGIGLGNHGFNIDFGSAVNDWAIMSGASLIQVQPDTAFNISFPEIAQWQFNIDGNLTFPDGTKQITAYTGGGGGGTYGNANVQALLASNVSLIGSSSNIILATLGAGSTTTVTQEGGTPGVSGQGTITSSNSPGVALVQPGWTVTGNNLVGTTTVTNVSGPDGFGTYTITTDTTEVDPFWYNDVYTFTSNTPSYSNITVSSGNIINAGTYGQINFVANSSGDGYGLSTIQLVPYTAGYDSAYIIIDPTYPNHIHIRAGGEQDNSPASLILGGENSHFQIPSGANSSPYIKSNGYNWQFGTDGTLTLPTGGNLVFDSSATSIIDGVTDINAVGTIGANVIQVLSDLTSFGASPAPRIYGFSSIATTGSAVNEGNISASGNLVASQGAYVYGNVFAARYNFANGVNILSTVGAGSYGNSNVATYLPTYTGNFGAARVQVTNAVDFMYGGFPYMGWQLSGSDTLKLRTNIASGDYTDDAIIVDRQSLAVNVVATLTAGNIVTTNGLFWSNGVAYSSGGAASTGNITFSDTTISTAGGAGQGIILNSAGSGEIAMLDYVGFNNTNPGYWLHIGDGAPGAVNNTGNISIDYNNGLDSSRASTIIGYAWWDAGGNGNNNRGIGAHRQFGIYKNDDLYTTKYLEIDLNSGNANLTNIAVSRVTTTNGVFWANGDNILSTVDNRVYLLEAYASVTYTLPGSFTEDACRYSVVSANVNVPSAWFNTSTYTFAPQKAGYWEITASYDVYRNAEASISIKKNNSIVATAGSFNAVAQQVTKIIYLNGSTDNANVFNVGGAALERAQFDSRSWFQARWVGA